MIRLITMAENPSVIIIFLKKFNSGIPSPPVSFGRFDPNLFTAAKMIKAILQIIVNLEKKETVFIDEKIFLNLLWTK